MTPRWLRVALLAFVQVLLVSNPASAQTIYKHTDAHGRVTYSSSPPQGATGQVEKIESDNDRNVIATPEPTPKGDSGLTQRLLDRQSLRAKLAADVAAARKRLADAQAALEKGREMSDDDRQWTLSRVDAGAKLNSEGKVSGRDGNVVCGVQKTDDGKWIKKDDGSYAVSCPSIGVPNEQYRERIAKLEAEVADAERALDQALQNQRRNRPD